MSPSPASDGQSVSEEYEESGGEGWPPLSPLDAASLLPGFPVDALPQWLGAYVESVSVPTQTPVDLASMLCLPVIATPLAKRVTVVVRSDWSEPVNVYTATALGSGERKSAVFRHMAAPVEQHERALIDQWKQAGAQGPSPRLVADDVTQEALASLMAEQGGRMSILSPEGGIFEILAGRYTEGRPNIEVFLKGHSGDTLRVDRKSRPPEFVPDAALTLGLAIQPGVINGLATSPKFRDRGLLARILYSMPTSKVGTRDVNPPPIPDHLRDTYLANVATMFKLAACELHLSDDALTELHAHMTDLEPRLGPAGDLHHIADWANKLTGAVVRIAALFHVCEHLTDPAATTISADTLGRATHVGNYLLEHALAVFDAMGTDPQTEAAKKVLVWIGAQHLDEFSQRDAHQALRGTFKKVGDLIPVLAFLVEHGYLRQEPQPKQDGSGRPPSPRYRVHPHAHNPQKSQYANPPGASRDAGA
jgi:hypothetical protein